MRRTVTNHSHLKNYSENLLPTTKRKPLTLKHIAKQKINRNTHYPLKQNSHTIDYKKIVKFKYDNSPLSLEEATAAISVYNFLIVNCTSSAFTFTLKTTLGHWRIVRLNNGDLLTRQIKDTGFWHLHQNKEQLIKAVIRQGLAINKAGFREFAMYGT